MVAGGAGMEREAAAYSEGAMKGENRAEDPVHWLARTKLADPTGSMATGEQQKSVNPVPENALGVQINACARQVPGARRLDRSPCNARSPPSRCPDDG